jgi:putative ABC transport system permease protein
MEHRAFADQLLSRAQAIPGVSSAAIVHNLPISGRRMAGPVVIENREPDPSRPSAHIGFVSPGYFRTMGIRLLRGRDFEPADADRGWVAIVNETFARTYFPGENPIGKKARTRFGPPIMKEIVGVVADVHQIDLTHPAEPVFYTFAAQDIAMSFSLVVRSDLPAPAVVSAVRGVVHELDPDQPLGTVATMQDLIARSVARPRFYALLLSSFALLAAALALFGLYAVLAQSVAQRRHEIGVRVALGAQNADIRKVVLNQGLRSTLLGAALGMAGAWAVTRVLRKLLFGVEPTDSLTFLVVTALLVGMALVSMVVPARKAVRTNPLEAFREN